MGRVHAHNGIVRTGQERGYRKQKHGSRVAGEVAMFFFFFFINRNDLILDMFFHSFTIYQELADTEKANTWYKRQVFGSYFCRVNCSACRLKYQKRRTQRRQPYKYTVPLIKALYS